MNKIRIAYKLTFSILGLATLLSCYIYNVVNGETIRNDYSGNYEIYTIDFLTTFTMLSNLFVLFWMLLAAIFYKKENDSKFLSYNCALTAGVYITVTFIIYNFVLVPLDTGFPSKPFDQYVTVVDHIITPIAFIIYLLILMPKKEAVNLNEFFLKRFWVIFCLILGYCILTMLRGELRFRSSGTTYVGEGYNLLYPYFFLNVHQTGPLGIPGYGWFMIAFIAIVGILIGFCYLYNWLNNIIIKKAFYQKMAG